MTNASTLTVFVVRHSERLDEALRKNGDRIRGELDPPITPQGHQQAHDAFSRLAEGFRHDGRKRKIALFSSPTKRTMGTTLMVATSGMGQLSMVEWGLQPKEQLVHEQNEKKDLCTINTKNETTNSNDESLCSPIPIIVLNGLASCAAAIARMRGAGAAVEAGLLPCADFKANDGSFNCPASSELKTMKENCRNGVAVPETSDSVQYWKVESPTGRMVPLAPPVSLRKQVINVSNVPSEYCRIVPQHCIEQRKREYFRQALDRAVLLAEADGCDTMIVVAHREGVRELVERWSTNGHEIPRKLNYCCIASFTVETSDDHSCRWCYHGVVDYQDFGVHSIPETTSDGDK
ncbi:hypothetical protein ACA910_005793 [Epithemia clementina (nom. ined.)]